ncbi:MAG: hypothetical protein HY074_18320 [Deltaproteobacteria bacterium]|nr:hypothetical protein [Deltaproteobacteria bacterium]
MIELTNTEAVRRGVYYFSGGTTCPWAEMGTRDAKLSNRLALDDDQSQVTYDPATKTVRLRNTHVYARKQLVGDILLLGTGQTQAGETVPLAFHTRFEKKGTRFDARPHLHPSVHAKLITATCEPVTVVLDNGKTELVALDQARLLKAWKYPPLASRLGRALIEVRDLREGGNSEPLVDLRVSLGLGRLSKHAVRIQLFGPRGCTLFGAGTWELRLEALMNLPSAREHVRRALFLLGLEQGPLVSKLADRGLKKGEVLAFRLAQDAGEIRIGTESQPVSQSADVARAYLEFDFVGAVLGQQLRTQLTRPAERAKPLAL